MSVRLPLSRLVVATHNLKKGGEMAQILSAGLPGIEIVSFREYPSAPEPEETGENYAENAAIKSESGARFTGQWCIADDAGLEIDALDGAPGLYSKRFGGEDLPFPEKMAKILELVKDLPDEQRSARFRCWIALSGPASNGYEALIEPKATRLKAGKTYLFEGICEGRIAREPRGAGGFGYDPIFYLPEHGRHMAEFTPTEKHAVSHRGRVLRKLIAFLRDVESI